jgi:hypothetical protein
MFWKVFKVLAELQKWSILGLEFEVLVTPPEGIQLEKCSLHK